MTRSIAVAGDDYRILVVVPAELESGTHRKLAFFNMGKSFIEGCIEAHINGGVTPPKFRCIPCSGEKKETNRFAIIFLEAVRDKKENKVVQACIARSDQIETADEVQLGAPSSTHWPQEEAQVCVIYWNATDNDLAEPSKWKAKETVILHLAAQSSAGLAEGDLARRWGQLEKLLSHYSASIVVTSANALGHLGQPLRHQGSWEDFADDVVKALGAKAGIMKPLGLAQQLVIRSGESAVMLATRLDDKTHEYRFYYAVDRPASLGHSGFLIGGSAVLTSSIAGELAEDGSEIHAAVESGIRKGIRRCLKLEERGYLIGTEQKVNANWQKSLFESELDDDPEKKVSFVTVPESAPWSIAQRKADEHKSNQPIAADIVRKGMDFVSKTYHIPFAKIGEATIIERREIEQYYELQAAMRSYKEGKSSKPLSLAVFGKPGGGKSFGVKQLAKNIGLEEREANVSQFQSIEDLAEIMHQSRDITLGGQVPLVFWDEFDSVWEGRSFGWLRYFLAPMQDGTFQHNRSTHKIGRAIFVFVGGVNHNFDMFEGRMRDDEFIAAKGIDFISRLRGHLDVLGISRTERTDSTYGLRRAVPLREFLIRHQPATVHEPEPKQVTVSIDEDVLNAFLGVEDFKHGLRSMEAIVQMCRIGNDQRRLTWAALPSPEQLQTHVSVRDFHTARQSGPK
jgi:hypothetical protein